MSLRGVAMSLREFHLRFSSFGLRISHRGAIQMKKSIPDHSKISPTAKLVAYWRQFSDIPYAHDVAQMIHAEEVFQEFLKHTGGLDEQTFRENMTWFAPMLEARYKSMVHAIRRENIKQVLELASGVSLRGLAMTTDPEMTYVETDLPGISEEKKAIVQKIREQENIPERNNLFFQEVNVLERSELEAAVVHFFEERPIAVIHEGLFQYLSLEEKKVAATHIHSLLKRFGGVWMTPDFNTKEDIDKRWNISDSMKELTASIRTVTQRDFRESAFEDDAHIHEFFGALGFKVQELPQIDESFELTSIKQLNVSEEVLKSYANSLKIWVLRVL